MTKWQKKELRKEKAIGRRRRMWWHCSWVSAPKRSAKIISAQIKLWPLPGCPRISVPLICLSNETPAHREPSGSPNAPAHTDTNTDTNSVRNTHRHCCITCAHTPWPLMASLSQCSLFQLRERGSDREPPGVSFLLWTSQINTLPPPLLLPITTAHTHLNRLYFSPLTCSFPSH